MCQSSASAVLEVPMDDSAPRHARRFVDQHWCAEHAALLRGHALLIASELVTLAVHHGAAPVRMTVECDGDGGATVSVSDADPNGPAPIQTAPTSADGRRLLLVDVLSDEWGVRTRPGGKTVWSRLVS